MERFNASAVLNVSSKFEKRRQALLQIHLKAKAEPPSCLLLVWRVAAPHRTRREHRMASVNEIRPGSICEATWHLKCQLSC